MDTNFMYFKDNVLPTIEIQNIYSGEIVANKEVVTSGTMEQEQSILMDQHDIDEPETVTDNFSEINVVENTIEIVTDSTNIGMDNHCKNEPESVAEDFGQDNVKENTIEIITESTRIGEEISTMNVGVADECKTGRNSRKRAKTSTSTSNSLGEKSTRKAEADISVTSTVTSSPLGTRKSARRVCKKQDLFYSYDLPKNKTKRQEDSEVDKLIKQIKETCTQLETLGKDVLVLIADIKGPKILGSKAGVQFANETKIVTSEFQHFCDEKRSKKTKTSIFGKEKFSKSPQKPGANTKGVKRHSDLGEVDKAAMFNKVMKVKLKRVDRNESETIGNRTVSVDKAVTGKDIALETVTMGENDGVEPEGVDVSDNGAEISDDNQEQSDIGDDEDDFIHSTENDLDIKNEAKGNNKGKKSTDSVAEKANMEVILEKAKELVEKWTDLDFGTPKPVTAIMNFEAHGSGLDRQANQPETFTCDKCGFVFLHSEHLKSHQMEILNCDRRDLKIPFYTPDDDRYDNLTLHHTEQSDKHGIFVLKDLLQEENLPSYRCVICKKPHQVLVQLKRHLLSHSNTNAFNCAMCGKQMKLFESFSKHILKHFTHPYGCEHCYKFCSSQDELNSHASKCLHTRVKILKGDIGQNQDLICETCGYAAPDKTTLVIHRTHHTKAAVVQCPLCELTLSVGSLKRHMVVVHQESKPVICETCGKQFKDRVKLKRHSKLHSGETFKCPVCGKSFADKEYLAKHMAIHSQEKKFICDHCGAGYNKKLYFDSHLRTHTGETPYACTVQGCGKKFRCGPNLRQHMKSHNPVGEYVCDFCGKQFKQRGQLSRHRKSHSDEFQWECVYCQEKFKSCWKYKQHLVIKHPEKKDEIERTTNIRLHKCKICGKLYHDGEDFIRHMNAHNGIKPYKCSYCSKGFVDRSNMKAHEHIHKGTMKFKCRVCYKSFLQENNLLKHMKSNHPELNVQEGSFKLPAKNDNREMLVKEESNVPDVSRRVKRQQSSEIIIDCLDNYQLQILETEETIMS